MLIRSILFIVFLSAPYSAWALKPVKCATIMSKVRLTNLQQTFDIFQDYKPSTLRLTYGGKWIQTNKDHWVRYNLYGKNGPIRIHFEGLGGTIRTALQTPLSKDYLKGGRLLVVEMEGQGLTEVHRRLQLRENYQDTAREILYDNNIRLLEEALPKIFEAENIKLKDIKVWSGHSYGGQVLAGLMYGHESARPTLQFLATGVTNHNNRFISQSLNSQFKTMGSLANAFFPQSQALKIQKGVEAIREGDIEARIKEDPIQMESLVGMTLGAGRVDTTQFPGRFPDGARVQVFTSQKDNLVFPMLHWELAQAARESGLSTSLVLVDRVGHNITSELTSRQAQTVNRMALNPRKYEGFYRLKTNGQIVKITPEIAEAIYLKINKDLWEDSKEEMIRLFRSTGATPSYPDSWSRNPH